MSNMSVREVRREPVAIIGAACRLPGAPTVEAFWEMLNTGRDMVTTMSPERRALEVTKPATDTRHIRPADGQGGFLDRIDAFDANFFGVSPYEAVRLDPQQRLLLETVWEAVEDAGLTADQLSGTRTGAYTSCFTSHYWNLATNAGMTDMHALLGSSRYSVAAGRIAHLLDLRGPALGVDATCASSLVAVHLACQAIQVGEVDMAIVGGVNLLLCRELDTSAEEAGLLSPTARCRFGDARADGMVRAEGAVTVVLKPLSKAVEDGDRVYATILGSGVASNGRQGQSLTDLGPDGMDDMLRTAYRTAGVSVADVDYVEAHGPGTPEGDISELTALSAFLRARFREEGRPVDQRCLVGSVKSNVGHTETAAGLAGLLKTALALRHRTIPRTLHVREPNSVFTADGSPIELVRTRQQWPDHGRAPIAGVTSLGMYGMNAHLVLTEGPRVSQETPVRQEEHALILPLSAKHPTALRQLAAAYADTLENAENPADVCHSAGARRTQHNLRLAVTGADRQALIDDLREFGSGGRALFPVGTDNRLAPRPRVVFVFPGQGSQWVGMGRELLDSSPVFADRMAECDRAISDELGWSLIERLRGDDPLTTLAEIQPALWAIQVGLAAMWRDWGIEPDLIIGHSMGELAAATTAGALTLRDGAAAVCRRSALMTNSPGDGAMWSVDLSESQAQEAIGEYADKVSVGAVNSAQSVVLSGDATALAAVIAPLRERGVFCRQVRANFASHSPRVEPLLAELRASLADVRPQAGQVPIHSTVLDRVVDGAEFDAEYWAANLRQPVRFSSAVQAALAESVNTVVIEISAHPVLTTSVEDGIDAIGANAIALPSVHRDSSETVSMLGSLATAYTRGCVANWDRVTPGRYVPLPSYPWQHKRFWISPANETHVEEPMPVPVPVPARAPARVVDVDSLTRHIKVQVAEVLSTSPDLIDPTMPLTFSGMDSLLAAKLRARVQQELDLHIPIRDFLSSPSLNHLAHYLAGTRQDS